MGGLYTFRDVRCAPETTPGTKVTTATARLLGKLTAPLGAPILHRPQEETGSLAGNTRTVVVGEELKMSFEGDCTFEQLVYLLNMGIKGITTPTGTSPTYTWAFKHTLTSPSTPKSFSFQFGDDEAVYDAEYVLASGLQISGKMDAPLTMKADLFGRNFAASSWNPAVGALASQTVETALSNKMRLYIDAAGGTIGSTEKAATIISFDWKLDTRYVPRKRGGSNLYFAGISQGRPKLTVDMTVEFNAGVEAEAVIFRAGTRRLFRLEIPGTGTKKITFDWSGVYTDFGPLEEQDGMDTVKLKTELELDTVFTDLFSATVINSVASLV